MLFDNYTPPEYDYSGTPVDPTIVRDGLKFDWQNNEFYMESGSPAVVSGGNAVKEWIELVVRTRQGRYPIYPVDFGSDALDIVGQKVPKGYGLSEFKRKMLESAEYNPGIANMDGFVYDGEKINIDVYLTDGTREVAEIEY